MNRILAILLLSALPALGGSTKLLSPKHTEHVASLGAPMLVAVAPSPPQLRLMWDYPADQITNVVFEVWHATTPSQGPPLTHYDQIPSGFSLLSVVAAPPVPIGGLAAEFFIVRAKNPISGVVSNWNQP